MAVVYKDGVTWIALVVLLSICLSLIGCSGGSGGGGHSKSSKPAFDLVETGLRSISYAPMYLQNQSCLKEYTVQCGNSFLNDDFMSTWAEPIWDDSGRGDLRNIASMGANAIRLYGNDPRLDKVDFLDAARAHGLQAIVGMSSYEYNGAGGHQCGVKEDADCHDAIRDDYVQILRKGFLDPSSNSYHTAIAVINVMNEPDFLGVSNVGDKPKYLKAVLTALDGILSAEKEAGVNSWSNGKLPRLTTTWSFATHAGGKDVCSSKYFIQNATAECGPGLTFMVQFYRVLHNPEALLGYTPKNDLAEAYRSRFINSFNTFNPARDIESQFLVKYNHLNFFEDIHVYCGEWNPHDTVNTQAELVAELKHLMKPGGSFVGASYFQYQVAYNKADSERQLGIFKLGKTVGWHTGWILDDKEKEHPINCLTTEDSYGNIASTAYVVEALTEAWGGIGPSQGMCSDEEAVLV